MRATPTVLLLALAGCMFLDAREKLRILPAGDLTAGPGGLRITVLGPADVETADLLVDDKVHATVYLGAEYPFGHDLPPGRYRVQARAKGASGFHWSDERTLTIVPRQDSSVPCAFDPPPGLLHASGLRAFELRCQEAVTSVVYLASGATWNALPGDLGLRFVLERSLEWYESFSVVVQVSSQRLGTSAWLQASWYLESFDVGFVLPDGPATNGSIAIAAVASPPAPPIATIYAGDLAIGDVGPGPWSLVWDTAGVAEGTYPLAVLAWGYHAASGGWPSVVVDRTPPRLVGWRTGCSDPDDFAARDEVALSFDEPVSGAVPGFQLAFREFPAPAASMLPWPAIVPSAMSADLSGLRDAAGNALGPVPPLVLTLRRWRSPFGVGPDSGVLGNPLAVTYSGWGGPSSESLHILGLDGAGTLWDVHGGCGSGIGSTPPPAAAAGAEIAEAAAQGRSAAIVERVGTGPGLLRLHRRADGGAWTAVAGALNGDPAQDASHPAFGAGGDVLAWSEAMPQGGRGAFVRESLSGSMTWAGTGIGTAGAVVEHPHASAYDLVYLETAPAQVPTVRAYRRDIYAGPTVWQPIGGALNADPAMPATDLAFESSMGSAAAWVEAGQVVVRLADDAGWGPPRLMNADPGRAARSPQLLRRSLGGPLFLALVQETAQGDEIRVWSLPPYGTEWTLLPEVVNAGAGTTVSRLVLEGSPDWYLEFGIALAWADASGQVYARVLNE